MSTIYCLQVIYTTYRKNEVSANMNQGRLIYHNYYITICKNKKKFEYIDVTLHVVFTETTRGMYQVATISGMEISVAFCKLIDV